MRYPNKVSRQLQSTRETLDRIVIGDPNDEGAILSIMSIEKRLIISVAEEQAVDSYNETFTCSVVLEPNEVIQLRDMLLKHFPLYA